MIIINKIVKKINESLFNNSCLYIVTYYNNAIINDRDEIIGIYININDAFNCIIDTLINKVKVADPNDNGFYITEYKPNKIGKSVRWLLDYRKLCKDIPKKVLVEETIDGKKCQIQILNDDYLRYCFDDEISNKIKKSASKLRNKNILDHFDIVKQNDDIFDD
jgi:hypothetical protein